MILLQTLLHFVTFLIIFLLSRWAGFYAAFLITQPSSAMTLLLAGLVIPLLFFPLTPMINFFSRRNEYEADRYSVMTYKNPQANILLLIKLTKENLSTIIPHPFYSFFHYSHPSLLERIRFIESLGTI
jgi:STE24 endopeptidase